ncbi:MAG: HupE/UreJ family protein [bacterium]
MKRGVAAGVALLLWFATPAYAHRLDEYLQATMIQVGKDLVQVQIRLTPGVAVFPSVLAAIDVNGDGFISAAEQRSYAERVLRDLSLAIDGTRMPLRLIASKFASIADMKEGRGEIQLDIEADVPRGGVDRRLTFENNHERAISVYLVNALVPRDPDVRITAQDRSYEQASYRLDYVEAAAVASSSNGPAPGSWTGFASVVRLGMRHIAEGTDHLLFLLVLLLPAPLVANGTRWGRYAGVKQSAARLLRVVTAFTIGHSLTLAAAATGWVSAPSGPVEVLIAVSIFVSALHALRPLFPGREAFVAGGFGLVHGLAFATMIAGYGIDPPTTALTVLGFNLGIEMMQLVVVVVTVPWLLMLARTPAYRVVRIDGAVVAGVASLGWMGERAFGLANPVTPFIELAADRAPLLAGALALVALGATAWTQARRQATLLPSPSSRAPSRNKFLTIRAPMDCPSDSGCS